jgi:hypothetical protein
VFTSRLPETSALNGGGAGNSVSTDKLREYCRKIVLLFAGLIFDPEDGGDMFLRNHSLSLDYAAL